MRNRFYLSETIELSTELLWFIWMLTVGLIEEVSEGAVVCILNHILYAPNEAKV